MTRPAPDFIRNETHFDGERIIGWRIITETPDGPPCDKGCLAPGSSPHRHSIDAGFLLVTESGIYEFDNEGYGVRASSLHPTDYQYPERA
jgi:hypothetical protein